MREDFLERELEKMCLESGQENEFGDQIYKFKNKRNI